MQSIQAIIATFPETFGLRAFPGKVFCISARASYDSPQNGPQMVTQINVADRMPARWLDFSRGTPSELRAEVVGGHKGYRDRATYDAAHPTCEECGAGLGSLSPGWRCYWCAEEAKLDQVNRLGAPAGQFY